MSQFVNSILNYYAAFTETRFSNKSTLNYKWLDDPNLTLDISFFTDFFRLWLTKLENNDLSPVEVRPGQFKRDDLLVSSFSREALQKFLADEQEGKDLTNPDELREAFLEGTRAYNLALRNGITQAIHTLQGEEIAAIEQQFHITTLPTPTFNVPKFSQDIYDSLQQAATECDDGEEYFSKVEACLKKLTPNIVLYDLLILLKQFAVMETYGTSYLFFGSIGQINGDRNGNYPLFFVEVNFDPGMADCIFLNIPRDLVMLNAPAINSFDFQNVLTIPRAASFAGSISHLRQMDSFLTGEYSLPPQVITTDEACFIPPPREGQGLPYLKYRFGLQIIKNEDKRILDYSELMTKIEKGQGSTIIDFVDSYLNGNVANTYDETNDSFRRDYPKNSPRYFYSDNPLPLNPSQKKILKAVENPKNRVVVIDGPPGTGKSHTIGAITYWANQNNKSIIITSHKTEALDVVERMLTDKFKGLHQHSKPSVIRITKTNETATLNSIDNSLSLPVIDGAARRAEEFNLDTVAKDKTKIRENLEASISKIISEAKRLPQTTQKLFRFLQLEDELSVDAAEVAGAPSTDIVGNLNLFQEFAGNLAAADFAGISLDSLTALYQRRQEIPQILDACNAVNLLGFDQEAVSGINPNSLQNIKECESLIERLALVFEPEIPLSRLKVSEVKAQKHDLQAVIDSFKDLQAAHDQLQDLVSMTLWSKIWSRKEYAAAREKFRQDFPAVWGYEQQAGIKPDQLLAQVCSLQERILSLKEGTSYAAEFIYSLARQPADFTHLTASLNELNSLKFDNVLSAIALLRRRDKRELTLEELSDGLEQLDSLNRYLENLRKINKFQEDVGLVGLSYKDLYLLLERLRDRLEALQPQTLDALCSVRDFYSATLLRVGIDFANIGSLSKLQGLTRDEQKLMKFITLHAELSGVGDAFLPEIRGKLDELNTYNQRLTEHANDLRLKGFQSHPADLQKIKRNIAAGKRLTTEQARLLCATYSCIIAEPEAVFKFFPMEEGLIDTLIFDEASQVSIAHSLSLILRAKQVVVFGDKYQYGAVSAVNVSRRYAIPTIVEVKRSSDSRIRREVVGQMLDYAANAVVYWRMEQIRAQFEATCQSQELEAEQVITDFLTPEANPEEFWQQMKTNLQAGKVRLVFVADKIPSELQRIVEFLNVQMDPAEVLALEVKQYMGQGLKTLVPKIIGLTAAVQQKKTSGSGEARQWDEPSFFQELESRRGVEEVRIALKILEWAKTKELRIWWGRGKKMGSFFPMFDYQGKKNFLISIWTSGNIEVQFQWMQTRPPFDNEAKRLELLHRLNELPGVSLPYQAINRRPSIALSNLKDAVFLKEFLDIFDWVIQEIKSESIV